MPPSALYLQPDHADPVIQEFYEWLQNNSIKGTNGPGEALNCPFMPFDALQAYLTAENRITKLLVALHVEVYPGLVENVLNHYIRAFTILTRIGKGSYIKVFILYKHLRDHRLPFLEEPAHFPTDPDFPTFWNSFFDVQFAFCPHSFGAEENNLKLEARCILPIVSKEVLAHGGSAFIYKVKLYPYYDKLIPAKDPSTESSKTCSHRPANTYVLKTYNTKDADRYYTTEVDAFMKLSTKKEAGESLIKLLGSYKQGDTYNILLEYADRGTLEDFFQTTDPPTRGKDINNFWSGLFSVIKALQRIHATERPDGFDGPDILVGWHQDVKPKNILIFSGSGDTPYDVKFKLGDLGLSHFKRTLKLDGKIVDGDVGGTKDYGAPECHRSDEFVEQTKLNVKPLIDIWSFGGVCSEAAVWVVLGRAQLNQYRHQRKQEICERGTTQDGSCFHDGEVVLRTVKDMHQRLLTMGEIRPGDHVTGPILGHMVEYMLDDDVETRDDALRLWKKSKKILEEAETKVKRLTQQTKPIDSDPVGGNSQDYGGTMPNTPPGISRESGQVSHENTPHKEGPPPRIHLRNISNNITPGRPSFSEFGPGRRSDTWHGGRNRNSDMRLSPFNENAPPSILNPPLRASPPAEERPELYGMTTDETGKVFDGPNSFAGEMMRSSSNPSRNGYQSFYEPESQPGPSYNHGSAPEIHSEEAPQRPNLAGESTRYENSPTAIEITPGKAMQRPPPNTATSPPMVTTPPALPPVELAVSTTKPEKPRLSFDEAKKIRVRHGSLQSKHQNLLNDLKDRDHVFLIDDSVSMKNHWDEVVSLFSVLAWIVKRLDDNGLEMYFTVSSDKKSFRDTTGAVDHLKGMSQSTYPNIDSRLQQILGKYQEDLARPREGRSFFQLRRSRVKPLSLYVFTDGAWQGCDAVAPIETMIEKLRQLGFPKQQVSIQFVRFGDDPSGIKILKYLDTGLRKKHTKQWDIVDTEPFQGGNLLKILLGATFPWFDDDDDEDEDGV